MGVFVHSRQLLPLLPGTPTRAASKSNGVVFVEPLAAVEATRDVERLALGPRRGRVGGEVAGRGDQEEGVRVELELAAGGLDALDRVEVAVLTEERMTERGLELGRVPAGREVGGDELAGLVHLLLAVEEVVQLGEDFVRVARATRLGEPSRGDVEEAIEVDAHRG